MQFLFVALLVAFVAQVFAGTYPVNLDANGTVTGSTCGGNCPSGTCSSCYCGTSKNVLSSSDIANWCAKYSWDQSHCKCIISHESGGNSHAQLDNTNGSHDIGLWQINSFNWDACSGGKAPCDVQSNLNCAIKVHQWGGNTWKYWSTCGACGACSSK